MRSPGRDLLVAASRPVPRPDDAETLSALAANVYDWEWVLRQAEYHRVAPLLQLHLREVTTVPGPVMERLRGRALEIAENNLRLAGEIAAIVDAMSSAGVLAVPVKGPLLAVHAYGNLAVRSSVDIDLIVRRRDRPAALRVLNERGYRGGPVDPRTRERFALSLGEIKVFRESGFAVDLQSTMGSKFGIDLDLESALNRATTVAFAGREVPSLSDADLLLFLCAHGAKHLWNRLSWIADVAALVHTRPDLDWDRTIEEAKRMRLARILAVGLHLAEQLRSELFLPPDAQRLLRRDPKAERLAAKLWARLFGEHSDHPFPFHPLFLRMREDPRDAVLYPMRLVLSPTDADWAWVPLPASLAWAYPLVRPFRALPRYTAWALRRGQPRARGCTLRHL